MLLYLRWLSLSGVFILATCKTYMVCQSPTMDISYTLCDERNPPIILFEPCVYSINGKFRTSISWIPKMNLHRLSVSVDIWYGPMTVSERRTILCSGEHDEFDFCGTLKGETVHTWIEGRFKQFNFAKGTYTINFNAFAGEQEECIFCGTINLTIKV
ncbi:lymphocyte antigen 96-like isoform X2 [Pelobates fuscus]|uniref:lymphocyte antigen 96-like isoform X2 n=1 Tax=Pelobates fuscus TaxID=191477 RepID=UPI002FE4F9BD